MSSCLTTAQNPFSSWGNGNSVGGCQLTGASRRSRAKLSSRSSNDFAQNAFDEMSTSIVRSCGVIARCIVYPRSGCRRPSSSGSSRRSLARSSSRAASALRETAPRARRRCGRGRCTPWLGGGPSSARRGDRRSGNGTRQPARAVASALVMHGLGSLDKFETSLEPQTERVAPRPMVDADPSWLRRAGGAAQLAARASETEGSETLGTPSPGRGLESAGRRRSRKPARPKVSSEPGAPNGGSGASQCDVLHSVAHRSSDL